MFPYLHKIYFLLYLFSSFLKVVLILILFTMQSLLSEMQKNSYSKRRGSIPISAIDKYGKVIEKCKKVLKDHPDSKYVSNAHLLNG